jgi:flagellar assembly protein FliH
VIRREVKHAPEITLDLVSEALELAAGSAEVQLRMHPDDLAALGRRVDEIAAKLHRLGAVSVVADGAISRGGCRVDTRFGSIDQQFEAQLARIELELA